jgi:hypothetical protein
MTINGLTLKTTPLATDRIELNDGQSAALSTLPVSTPTTSAIATAKADCVLLTGNQAVAGTKTFSSGPLVPTAATGTTTTQAASTAFVQQELGAGVASARALIVTVRNQSGSTMTAGTVVYISGATGNNPLISRAQATIDATSAQTIGLVQADIANNATGSVVIRGVVSGLNTQALTEGQQLYLSPTVAGGYTTTKQYAPNHLVYVGIVTRSHPTLGTIEVAIQNGYEMDEIHDVSAQNPTNGDLLRYNSTTGLWEKSALTAASVANTPAGNIAATTVQAAINELDSEKTTAAAALAAADAADIASKVALIEREGLRFDGTAWAVIGNGGIPAVGTGDFTVVLMLNPGTINGDLVSGAFGSLGIQYTGTAFGANKNGVISGGNFAVTLTSVSILVYARLSGVAYAYLNGVSLGTSTDANSYDTNSVSLMSRNGGAPFSSGSVSHGCFFNYALTQSEITALIGRGLVTLPEQRGGSMTALNTTAFTNINFDSFSGASATGFTASANGNKFLQSCNIPSSYIGQKLLLTFNATITGAGVQVYKNNQGPAAGVLNGANSIVLTVTSVALGTYYPIVFNQVGTGTLVVSGFSIIPLGTLFEQDSGQRNAGYMVRDTSGNNCDLILPATGVSVIDPAMRGMIRFTTTTSGNQQIGGTQVIIPTNARISSWVINSSGTPNVTLGNVSAGAQYRASAAVVSGDNQITLLTPFTSTGNLWVNSSTTATLKHTIQWEYIQ